MSENTPSEEQPLPPVKIAFIIDNKVVDILHTDNRLAAIFLSEPLILDVTDNKDVNGNFTLLINSTYDPETGIFTMPQQEQQ